MRSLPKGTFQILRKQFAEGKPFLPSVAAYFVDSFGAGNPEISFHFVKETLRGTHMQFGIESYHCFATFFY